MAKAKTTRSRKSILTDKSEQFLREYINNASPVGFETWGQKLWIEYLKPYVDNHFIDPYALQGRKKGKGLYLCLHLLQYSY